MKQFRELIEAAFFYSWQRTAMVIAGLILALALPITIYLTNQQQDLRQRASEFAFINPPVITSAVRSESCDSVQVEWTLAEPSDRVVLQRIRYTNPDLNEFEELSFTGTQTAFRIPNLDPTVNYFIAVTNFDIDGKEITSEGYRLSESTCSDVVPTSPQSTYITCSNDQECPTGQACNGYFGSTRICVLASAPTSPPSDSGTRVPLPSNGSSSLYNNCLECTKPIPGYQQTYQYCRGSTAWACSSATTTPFSCPVGSDAVDCSILKPQATPTPVPLKTACETCTAQSGMSYVEYRPGSYACLPGTSYANSIDCSTLPSTGGTASASPTPSQESTTIQSEAAYNKCVECTSGNGRYCSPTSSSSSGSCANIFELYSNTCFANGERPTDRCTQFRPPATPTPTSTPTPTFGTSPTATPTPLNSVTMSPTTCDPVKDGVINELDFQLWRDEFTGPATTQLSTCFSTPLEAPDLLDFQAWRDIYTSDGVPR